MEVIAVPIFVDSRFAIRDRRAKVRIVVEKLYASFTPQGEGHLSSSKLHVHTDFTLRHHLATSLAACDPNDL